MTLKAVLFDFNGVIIDDESIHEKLIEQILIDENLRPKRGEFRQICLGRSDRACIIELLGNRGRVVSDSYLNQLIAQKQKAYQEELAMLESLPIFPGLKDFIDKLNTLSTKIAVVSGALRSEIEFVLERASLAEHFSIIVAGDDLIVSKPEPDGYLLAVERLNEKFPQLKLQPAECLVIEDTPAGIQAAKRAGMQVVGVSNSYPLHMLQRQANWVVDRFWDLELERVRQVFEQTLKT